MNKLALLLVIILLLPSCSSGIINPFTTVPAAMLGAYDKYGKRDKWLKYAENGDVYAQYELAQSYAGAMFEGTIDNQKAIYWYCKAAKNGYAKAQVIVGNLYENTEKLEGLEIARDNAKAYMWYSMAARRINEDARKSRHNLKELMSFEELARAKQYLANPRIVPCGNHQANLLP